MTDYEKLHDLINEIDTLIDSRVTTSDPDFIKWRTKADRFLSSHFGEKSEERTNFLKTSFTPICFTMNGTRSEFIGPCKHGLIKTKEVFSVYFEEMEEEIEEGTAQSQVQVSSPNDYSKVFIVHGHDGELKSEVARLIEKQGIEAIILNEQTNSGQTIIEKLENNSNVSSAICLFTPDDIGNKAEEENMNPRARQNVVFETGYFMGKLGRNRIVILANEGVELPSDLSGVVYTNKNYWQIETLKELKAMGFNIDFNKLYE